MSYVQLCTITGLIFGTVLVVPRYLCRSGQSEGLGICKKNDILVVSRGGFDLSAFTHVSCQTYTHAYLSHPLQDVHIYSICFRCATLVNICQVERSVKCGLSESIRHHGNHTPSANHSHGSKLKKRESRRQ